MRRAWCLLARLASTLLLVVSACTDAQAAPPEQRLAQSAPESVSRREKGMTTHQEIVAQRLPAPTGLAITESVVSQPPPPPRAEMMPLAPLPSHVWMPGYWVAQGQNWVWRQRRWQ